MNTNGDLKDKNHEIDVHNIRLILDNIKLYNDNIKLIHEISSLRERMAELEKAKSKCNLCALMRNEKGCIVVLSVKNKNDYIN
jgi:hypothetical protein